MAEAAAGHDARPGGEKRRRRGNLHAAGGAPGEPLQNAFQALLSPSTKHTPHEF
jgi:hypothetical protein